MWGAQAGPRALPLCPAQSSSSSRLLSETRSCHHPPRTSGFLCPEQGSQVQRGAAHPPGPWPWPHGAGGVCSVGSDPASAPGAAEGASAPLDRWLQGHRDVWVPLTRMCSLSAPPEPRAGVSPGSQERLWERPRQTPRWLQGVSWGSVGHPGLGERALDQAQDDSMRKKCPQEEDLASTAKTTTLVTASSPLSPQWEEQGDSRLPAPYGDPKPEAGTFGTRTHPLSVSVSRCLCHSLTVSVSHRLCVSPSLSLAVSVSHCLAVSVSLCLTVSFTVSVSHCLCI